MYSDNSNIWKIRFPFSSDFVSPQASAIKYDMRAIKYDMKTAYRNSRDQNDDQRRQKLKSTNRGHIWERPMAVSIYRSTDYRLLRINNKFGFISRISIIQNLHSRKIRYSS